mmetsp:Transcript_21170/g.58791  ORF Transcript_21170/g.58791 Transcript_21170/m.58791 type:complete len:521 (-) Transcript_21170:1259-2821(-)|eukprot:CAMPEP_0202337676 /NCGR_PEP_ID=MMETSP1126-20121109/266_1 /ASSEMBLY_ACC=CAM_ASM_000457 /TAXON_ID=3047 /ORGANISM="Dunaliella tertiolecta, Strain CCMP1320" /LENGTH=520 /DNA_ID=CAMNT_0048927921 /DNA_START=1543 /DNA_END=3105 /DNA_ORIENTATION=+
MVAQTQTQLYQHAAEPKAVQQRAKYREEDASQGSYPSNIMFDRRVVRGNTYAARILPADVSLTDTQPKPSTQKRRTVRPPPPRTPEAVDGRRHIDIQTDTYLEELTDTVPEADNQTQTDAFLDRPPTPIFVPQKSGVDVTTQIENGDLFDFDYEVEPILEVLMGKILEQGLMEVLEEEELAAMRSHQEHFEQIRNAELVATQRMEAAEKRKIEEKERRLAQEQERVERERVVRRKVAASTFARGYLSGIVSSVFDGLQQSGFFYDPVLRDVEENFMPWLQEQAIQHLSQGVLARQVVRKLVEDATVQLSHSREEAAKAAEAQARAASEWEAKQAQLKAAKEAAEMEELRGKAKYILEELQPPIASEETIQATREELITGAEAAAEAAFEAKKQEVEEKTREEAEAKAADQQARLEELREAAANAAAEREDEEGEGGHEEPEVTLGDEPMVDVEAEVAAAVEKVEKEEPKEITDGDVMSALIDKEIVTKDSIVQALAISQLGEAAYIRHMLFQPPPKYDQA